MGVLDILQKGGPLMWLLVLCSLTALGAFAERIIYFHRASMDVGDFLTGLSTLIRKGNYTEALQEAANTPGPVARVIRAALARRQLPRTELRDIVQEAGQLEVPKLERNLPLLSTVAYVAPLIGLLGTVVGLLESFQVISNHSGYTTAADMAGGIYQSLLTTGTGIAIAIPAYVAFCYLSSRANEMIHDMERGGIEVLHLIHDSQVTELPAKTAP
ncbi:MAG: MotA/TolQ/ExbB proton channel family protein [Chthoniobacterales bacterium]